MTKATSYTFFLKQGAKTSLTWHPTGAESLFKLVEKDPTVMHWPIVIDYNRRQIAFTQAGVRSILQALVKERGKLAESAVPQSPTQTSVPRILPRKRRSIDCESCDSRLLLGLDLFRVYRILCVFYGSYFPSPLYKSQLWSRNRVYGSL